MKVYRYNIGRPIHGVCKQDALWVTDKKGSMTAPVIYFQRPTWIKDDAVWRKLMASIEIKLPQGFEVK